MTGDRDPFELLPNFVDPEPDPAIMHAVIAQSRDAFANRRPTSQGEPVTFGRWLRRSATWLMPAGLGVAALVVAMVVAPGLMQTNSGSGTDRDVIADLPTDAPPNSTTLSRGEDLPADAASPNPGTRMGMQPGPGVSRVPIEPLPQTVSSFEGDGVVIGTRLDAEAMEIFLPELSGEQTIDVQSVMPGEEIEILSAFATPDSDLVAVHFRVNDVRFWRIYHLVDGKYGRDPERSQRVSDAADKAEVERRLAEPAG
jgi:hypothetical protein